MVLPEIQSDSELAKAYNQMIVLLQTIKVQPLGITEPLRG